MLPRTGELEKISQHLNDTKSYVTAQGDMRNTGTPAGTSNQVSSVEMPEKTRNFVVHFDHVRSYSH